MKITCASQVMIIFEFLSVSTGCIESFHVIKINTLKLNTNVCTEVNMLPIVLFGGTGNFYYTLLSVEFVSRQWQSSVQRLAQIRLSLMTKLFVCFLFCSVQLSRVPLKDHTQTRCHFISFCWNPSPATRGIAIGHVRLSLLPPVPSITSVSIKLLYTVIPSKHGLIQLVCHVDLLK